MRIFFLLLLLIALVYSCNRDATDAVGSTAASTYVAPAAAPRATGNNSDELSKANFDQRVGQKKKNLPPVDDPSPAVGDPQEEKRAVGAGRTGEVVNQKAAAGVQQKRAETNDQLLVEPKVSIAAITEPSLFKISKTPCYGNCKQYSVSLHKGGLLAMNGKRNVRHEGWNTQQMMSFKYQELGNDLAALAASDLAAVYPENETIPADLPATVLRFTDPNGEDRTIRVYDLDDAPEPLAAFLQKVERLVEEGVWNKAVQ